MVCYFCQSQSQSQSPLPQAAAYRSSSARDNVDKRSTSDNERQSSFASMTYGDKKCTNGKDETGEACNEEEPSPPDNDNIPLPSGRDEDEQVPDEDTCKYLRYISRQSTVSG